MIKIIENTLKNVLLSNSIKNKYFKLQLNNIFNIQFTINLLPKDVYTEKVVLLSLRYHTF